MSDAFANYSREIDLIARTPMTTGNTRANDLVAHFTALRKKHMGLARLCATDKARCEYVDFARAASWQVRAQKAKARLQAMRFGRYGQREIAPGVWKLEVMEAA